MRPFHRRQFMKAGVLALGVPVAAACASDPKEPLALVVMDPLAAPLACSCVKGYAQRDYEKLAKHLEKSLGRPVAVFFGTSLSAVMAGKSNGKADIVIGKESVVKYQAKEQKIDVKPVAS